MEGGGGAFCFIVYVVRNLVEKDGEGSCGLNSLVELTWRVFESGSEPKKKVANGVVTDIILFR